MATSSLAGDTHSHTLAVGTFPKLHSILDTYVRWQPSTGSSNGGVAYNIVVTLGAVGHTPNTT